MLPDRFIPRYTNREPAEPLPTRRACFDADTVSQDQYREMVYAAVHGREHPTRRERVLSYRPRSPAREPTEARLFEIRDRYIQELSRCRIPERESVKAVDAENLPPDFYLTALAAKDRLLGAVTADSIFVQGTDVEMLDDLVEPDSHTTCLHWLESSATLCAGFANGRFSLCDLEQRNIYRAEPLASGEIDCAQSSESSTYFGTTSGAIMHVDMRDRSRRMRVAMHDQRVTGLALHGNKQVLASGGNDNAVHVWDMRAPGRALASFDVHNAAVKAITWAPWNSDLLFTGGGTNDRTIKALSVSRGQVLSEASMNSQVTAIHASSTCQQVVSCHGFSQNNAVVWDYENGQFQPLYKLVGHTDRVLFSAMQDATTLVTGSPDETIRTWKVFDTPKKAPTRPPLLLR